MSSARIADLLVILLYMSLMVLIGLRFGRRQTTTEAYFVAKRQFVFTQSPEMSLRARFASLIVL